MSISLSTSNKIINISTISKINPLDLYIILAILFHDNEIRHLINLGNVRNMLELLEYIRITPYFANVGVVVQNVTVTAEQYRKLTLRQFKTAGIKLLSESKKKVSGRDALMFNYEGRMQGQLLRWLALAVIDKDKVFLITCTARKDGFGKLEKRFKDCLTSFKIPK